MRLHAQIYQIINYMTSLGNEYSYGLFEALQTLKVGLNNRGDGECRLDSIFHITISLNDYFISERGNGIQSFRFKASVSGNSFKTKSAIQRVVPSIFC